MRKMAGNFSQPLEHPAPGGLEQYKILRRRVLKAERDERMDITTAMTPSRTYVHSVYCSGALL